MCCRVAQQAATRDFPFARCCRTRQWSVAHLSSENRIIPTRRRVLSNKGSQHLNLAFATLAHQQIHDVNMGQFCYLGFCCAFPSIYHFCCHCYNQKAVVRILLYETSPCYCLCHGVCAARCMPPRSPSALCNRAQACGCLIFQ